jgi:hypothetical protein
LQLAQLFTIKQYQCHFTPSYKGTPYKGRGLADYCRLFSSRSSTRMAKMLISVLFFSLNTSRPSEIGYAKRQQQFRQFFDDSQDGSVTPNKQPAPSPYCPSHICCYTVYPIGLQGNNNIEGLRQN